MNGRNAPLSPVSLGDSDWSSFAMDKDGPYGNGNSRGQLISPPSSGGSMSSTTMNMNNGPGFPMGPRNGGPSPPPSIGRSSVGTNMYARSESGRSQRDENFEYVLAEHYVCLKRFLSQTSRDGRPTNPVNKARDKLQRLTPVQFLELSTDVFDELMRRQASSRRPPPNAPPNNTPSYLLPEDNFHPKRNQARQKLASLGPPRFRDLATDVFCELERRFPNFAAGDIPRINSPASMRGPPSRSGTPVNGGVPFPPRGQSRRRPSEAGSVMSMRSGFGLGVLGGPGGPGSVPPSPGLPPNGYDRPLQKQAQSNTIVPNKSTMVEEDDDPVTSPGTPATPNGVNGVNGVNGSKTGTLQSEATKRMADDYEAQLKTLREQLAKAEAEAKTKQEEMDAQLDEQRRGASASDAEKEAWMAERRDLENQLAEAASRAESLQEEMARMRNDHAVEERQLRAQVDELRQSLADAQAASANGSRGMGGGAADEDLVRENEELRQGLMEQQAVTEEVRGEAERFLEEMRELSQQSGSAWARQAELERTIESLEAEVRDWRNRYARTKTQLRNLRASSMGLTIEADAGQYVREKGFTADGGLVKDVHVTKFQIAVDELLQRARTDKPEKTIDSMKVVVMSVRRIAKDLEDAKAAAAADEVTAADDDNDGDNDETALLQRKLKTRVSAAANNLITASKNFAAAAGLSPVALLDAAASHLVVAVVDLLRTVKIRATPAGELEDDDDGTLTPVDSSVSFFSTRRSQQGGRLTAATTMSSAAAGAAAATGTGMAVIGSGSGPPPSGGLPPPPPFEGFGGLRDSAVSSAYSAVSSPRQSGYPGTNGIGASSYLGMLGKPETGGGGSSSRGSRSSRADARTEELKAVLDDQTATLVQTIQDMVGLIRGEASVAQIGGQIDAIAAIVSRVVSETEACGLGGPELDKLVGCRQRLVEAGQRGEALAAEAASSGRAMDMRGWTTGLPPIAFEMARETKELVKRVDRLVLGGGDGEDFS